MNMKDLRTSIMYGQVVPKNVLIIVRIIQNYSIDQIQIQIKYVFKAIIVDKVENIIDLRWMSMKDNVFPVVMDLLLHHRN